jgi:hypothetical protein
MPNELQSLFSTHRPQLEAKLAHATAGQIASGAGVIMDLKDSGPVTVEVAPRSIVEAYVPQGDAASLAQVRSQPPSGHIHVLVRAGASATVETIPLPTSKRGQA